MRKETTPDRLCKCDQSMQHKASAEAMPTTWIAHVALPHVQKVVPYRHPPGLTLPHLSAHSPLPASR